MNKHLSQNSNSLIDAFGLHTLPPEILAGQVSEIGQMIFEEMLQRALPMLSEADLVDYEKLVDRDTEPDELLNFFFQKIPNFQNLIEDEKSKFLQESQIVIEKISH